MFRLFNQPVWEKERQSEENNNNFINSKTHVDSSRKCVASCRVLNTFLLCERAVTFQCSFLIIRFFFVKSLIRLRAPAFLIFKFINLNGENKRSLKCTPSELLVFNDFDDDLY